VVNSPLADTSHGCGHVGGGHEVGLGGADFGPAGGWFVACLEPALCLLCACFVQRGVRELAVLLAEAVRYELTNGCPLLVQVSSRND